MSHNMRSWHRQSSLKRTLPMYDPQTILGAIDAHTPPAPIGFNLATGMAVAMSHREKWISIPLPCTFVWFAHDLGVVARFDTWFHTYDHWFLKLFWVGLLAALLLELVFPGQAVRFGQKEFLPNGSRAQWTALVSAGAGLTALDWEYQKTIRDDPLYQALAATTLFIIPLFVVPLVLRRGSAVSESPVVYGCFAAMAALWGAVTVSASGDAFRTWQYVASGMATFITLDGVSAWIHLLRHAERLPGPTRPD